MNFDNIKTIVSGVREKDLELDPINKTIIFYFMLGMPGLGKTNILENLQKQLSIFDC